MNKFTVRPGYGSKELLIEFTTLDTEDLFLKKMLNAFKGFGYTPSDIKDLIFLNIVEFKTPWGTVSFEHDEWDFFWISAENNLTIENFAKQLEELPFLERYEVDWSEYKKTKNNLGEIKEEERMESMMNDGCQTSLLFLALGVITIIIITSYLN